MEGHDQLVAGTVWQQPWMLPSSWCTYFSRPRYSQIGEGSIESFSSSFVSREFASELKRVNYIAWPMIVVSLSQFLLRLSPMFVLGHLGELPLAGASMATTFCNVTGFSVIVGMASALETLCGQAYGAEQYQQVGNFTQAANLCLIVICVPISILWVFTDKLFIFIGQDPSISNEAGKYAIWLVPSLFAYAILQTLTRYLQIQNLMLPILFSSLASLFFDILLCWVLEWWCFELVILLSGMLPTLQIEVNVLSISMTITSLHFNVPYSFGAAASTRISNELGAGNPRAAQLAVYTVLILSTVEFAIAAAAIFFCRNVVGYAFIKEKEVAVYIEEMAPLLCLSIILDSMQAVLSCIPPPTSTISFILNRNFTGLRIVTFVSGVARDGGWQQIAAYVNLGAYYVVGIPVALVTGFGLRMRGEGLWMGLVAGAAVQCFLFSLVTCLTDWEKKVHCLSFY